MKTIILATSVLLGAVSASGQEPVDPKFQEKIDKAVEKGPDALAGPNGTATT